MALGVLPRQTGFLPWAPAHAQGGAATGIGSPGAMILNAAGDKLAVVFAADRATPPDAISFYISVVTTAGSAGAIEATLETLDSNGDPSGTPVTNSATGSVTTSTVGAKTITGMAGTASLTPGIAYAVVLTAGSGWNRNLQVLMAQGSSQGAIAFPNTLTKESAGSWDGSLGSGSNSGFPFGLATTTEKILHLGLAGPYSQVAVQAFSDSTNPDTRGNRFTVAWPMSLSHFIAANSLGSIPDNTDDGAIYVVRDPLGSPVDLITPHTYDGETFANALNRWLPLPQKVICYPGVEYGIAIKATAAGDQNLARYDYDNASDLGWHCGTDFYSITRNGTSGAFSSDTAKVYCIYPIFDQILLGPRARSLVGVM